MAKSPRKRSKVKSSEDARVTPASAEAATDGGDGGRVLDALDPLERFERTVKRLSKSFPSAALFAQFDSRTEGNAEPEPPEVAASALGAPEGAVCEPPPAGGGGAAGTQGGPLGSGGTTLGEHAARNAGIHQCPVCLQPCENGCYDFRDRPEALRRLAAEWATWAAGLRERHEARPLEVRSFGADDLAAAGAYELAAKQLLDEVERWRR